MAARKKIPKKKAPKKKTERNLTRELSTLLGKRLLPDLKERAKEPQVAAALAAEFEAEKQRTADNFDTWMSHKLEQVAVAWILSCVFVRTLEDRGYLTHCRLAGEGVQDAEHLFFDLFPSLTSRDYLLAVFRELSHLPGAEDVLGPKRNLAWRLAPSSEVVRELLAVFRETDRDGQLVWRFAGSDTRFLGDLYQDISEGVRERFALLQTPEFVEEFILDLTLEPAVREFGLETVHLLDPTCGSGHFLLGAFRRLFDARQRHAPGLPVKEHATAALTQVAGADINPYAVAIARFRLVLAYLEVAQIEKLRDAPRLSTNVVAVDSLLVGADQRTLPLAVHSENAAAWGESHWQLEDREEALRVFRRQYYHAIVGNPPYITCKDAKLRDEYRAAYPNSASGKYALGAPFTERFFQLAIDGGFVGMINSNSFTKREFGKKLIENVLSKVDLTRLVDTAGAHVPGHGTPTVMVFGRCRAPLADTILVTMGKRGEPTHPEQPERGVVWSSIRDHSDDVGFENDFISVTQVQRSKLQRHPWSLGGGGAQDLMALLEAKAAQSLGHLAVCMGSMTVTGEDQLFVGDRSELLRRRTPAEQIQPFHEGEDIRDWSVGSKHALYPYDSAGQFLASEGAFRMLWPYRAHLAASPLRQARKRRWNEYGVVYLDKLGAKRLIAWASIATHNHFALATGSELFKQSAPVMRLPDSATEADHFTLLAYLNSSTACFWMKQVFQPKSSEANADHPDAERNRYEFASTQLAELPVPAFDDQADRLAELAAQLATLGAKRRRVLSASAVEHDMDAAWRRADIIREKMVALQEEVDWTVYALFGLAKRTNSPSVEALSCPRGSRPFESITPRRSFVRRNDQALSLDAAEIPPVSSLPAELKKVWEGRIDAIKSSDFLGVLEQPLYKRMWRDTDQNVDEPTFRRREMDRRKGEVTANSLERCLMVDCRVLSARNLGQLSKIDLPLVQSALEAFAVPFASRLRFTDAGFAKRLEWERVWVLQRREDAGEKLDIPAPPKYDGKDYRDPIYWRLRGKLDVAKERFISYPGAEKDDDPSALYGWAGWDHLQQATALAGLYHARKTEEAWPPDRLVPLLAGLLELVPWLKQWHNAPSDDLGGEGAGDWYDRYVAAEARSLSKTLDDLRAWRPTPKAGRSRAVTR